MNCCCWPSSQAQEGLHLLPKDPSRLKAIFMDRDFKVGCAFPHPEEQEYRFVFPNNPRFGAYYCLKASVIVCDVPKKDTLSDFLKMCYEGKTNTIITIVQPHEYSGRQHIQPVDYLKDELDCEYLVSRDHIEPLPFMEKSILQITPKKEGFLPKSMTHYSYKVWVNGTCGNRKQLAELARIVMDAAVPILQSWTAGERATTLAAIVAAYLSICRGDDSIDVISNTVSALRLEVPGAVGEASQLKAVYETTKTLLMKDGRLQNL